MGWLIVGLGALTICGAVLEWDWFMNGRKARHIVALLGRSGARVAYVALGAVLAALGALVAGGVVSLGP